MMPNIESEARDTPSTKLRRTKKLRSMSGAAVRRSTISSTANAAGGQRKRTDDGQRRRRSLRQGLECQDRRYHGRRQQHKAEPVGGSACRTVSMRGCRRAAARPANATHISGIFSQNITRQLAVWVSRPPNNGPILKPSIKEPLQAPIDMARRCGAALVPTAASVRGPRKRPRDPARPPHQQCALTARKGDNTGCDAKQCKASHRYQACAEPVRRFAAKHNAGCRHDQVGVDRPLSANHAKAEFSPHGRQGSHDRGTVDANSQHGQAGRQQHDHAGVGPHDDEAFHSGRQSLRCGAR